MRSLNKIDEFRREAGNALFTKQQAVAVTLRLLEMESNDPNNTQQETEILNAAMRKINFTYLDATHTQTDALLDSLSVARLTANDIIEAINLIIFEQK